MLKQTLFGMAFTGVLVAGQMASANVINPIRVVSEDDPFNGAINTINNSAMSVAVNTGDSIPSALAATHAFDGGFTESYVSNASGADYFILNSGASIVYDLTGGGNTAVNAAIFWQYQNNGGTGTAIGNQAKDVEIRVNTEAQGSAVFGGSVFNGILDNTIDTGEPNPAQLVSFGSTVSGRYIEVTFTDNHVGSPGVTAGGDRVGIGEVRFAVPEPASIALLGLGGLMMLRRRRA